MVDNNKKLPEPIALTNSLPTKQNIFASPQSVLSAPDSRGGLAVELGPGRFDSEGARNYASEKFGGHSLGKFFVDTAPGSASKYI